MTGHPSTVLPTVLGLCLAAVPAYAGRDTAPAASVAADAGASQVTTWRQPRPVIRPGDTAAPLPDPTLTHITVNHDPEGDMPRNVVYTPDGSEIAIVHRDTDTVTFFDTDTLAPTHTVTVGDFPVDVAVSPDGQWAVVPNVLDNTVSIIDVSTHTLAATVPVTGEQPYRVAVSPDSAFALVGVINDATNSAFSVIDLALQEEIRSIPTTGQGVIGWFATTEGGIWGNILSQFALSADGATIVLPDRANDRVMLYDMATGGLLAELPTVEGPTAVDISADGTTAVVSHEGGIPTITEIDLPAQKISGQFSLPDSLTAQVIRITPDKAFAMAAISNNMIFVDLESGATTATVSTGSVGDIEISYDGVYAFVSNYNARVIKIASQSLVDTIPFAACVDAAASPTELRAVALNNRFRENVHFYNINGSAGYLEGYAGSGAPPEGDAPLAIDVSADGTLAVVANVLSENVSILDLTTDTVRSYVDVGDRPKDVRITPDGAYAVVCAMDANAAVIIDLATDTVVKSLTINDRPGRVRISPDSQYAYVLNVAGTDRISFILLDGADSKILAQESAGQTGVAYGYYQGETSGIELSDDGATLAVCDSFNDFLRIFDTASHKLVGQVAVGDFPIRAGFAPDGNRIYVTNAFGDSVSVVENLSGSWKNVGTVYGIDMPLTVDVDAAAEYVYVGNAQSTTGIRVIDAEGLNIVKTIPFADGYPRDSHYAPAESRLYTVSYTGQVVIIDAAGPASVIADTIPMTGATPDMAYSQAAKTLLAALVVEDGADIVRMGKLGDITGDGVVDVLDLLELLAQWGPCPPPPDDCPADLNGDGIVDVLDLLILLANWG